MREWRYLLNGSSLALDAETCIGCGSCVEVCPHDVFLVEAGKARIRDRALCMECGACSRNCTVGALGVSSGVGCAAAIIAGKRGLASSGCGCSTDSSSSCC